MIFWTVVAPEKIGIFNDFYYLLDNYEEYKDYMKPFRSFHEAYEYLDVKLTWSQMYALEIEQLYKLLINHWYEVKTGKSA